MIDFWFDPRMDQDGRLTEYPNKVTGIYVGWPAGWLSVSRTFKLRLESRTATAQQCEAT